MKTLADVKRRLVPGTKVNVTNHFRPEASGLRTMERNQTANMAWRMPDGKLTWLDWPKAKEVVIEGPDRVTFLHDPKNGALAGKPFLTIEFVEG